MESSQTNLMHTQDGAGKDGDNILKRKISVLKSKWCQRRGPNSKAGLVLRKHLLNRASAILKSDITCDTSFCHKPVGKVAWRRSIST